MLEDFRRMSVGENGVSFEILIHLDKVQIAPGIFACSAGTRLAVTDDRSIWCDPTELGQRPPCQNDARSVAARVRDQSSLCNFLGIELRDPIGSFTQPR